MTLPPDVAARFHRQILLPEIGREGQARLSRATVTLIGVGGLGAPASLYLAACGVGHLRLVDGDRIALENCHRQIHFAPSDVDRSKVEITALRLAEREPFSTIETIAEDLTPSNALSVLRGSDLIVDGSDRFSTRYLVNDAALFLGLPFLSGSIDGFTAQLGLFNVMLPEGERGPSYRCIFPDPPPSHRAPPCSVRGVLGTATGVVGTMLAHAATMYLAGASPEATLYPLTVMDLRSFETRRFKARRCSDLTQPYEESFSLDTPISSPDNICHSSVRFSTLPPTAQEFSMAQPSPLPVRSIEASLLIAALESGTFNGESLFLVDVREEFEVAQGVLPGAIHVPLGEIPNRSSEVPREGVVVVYCAGGVRSAKAIEALTALDPTRTNLLNLDGGIMAFLESLERA